MILHMTNSDKTTQTYVYTHNGLNVNLNYFKEQYEAKLATCRWHFEGGSVKQINRRRDSTIKSKQIQTMASEVTKIYYAIKKVSNCFISDSIPEPDKVEQ